MPNPVFDRVDETPDAPPTHLSGATSDQINAYWMEREKKIRLEANQPPAPNPPAPPATPVGMSEGQARTLIAGAELLASQGKEHWSRFLPEVRAIMGQMKADQQMDASMWATVYEKVVGAHLGDLVKEAREAALRPPISESSTPSTPSLQPRTLTENELHVVDQLRRAGAVAVRTDAAGKKISVPFDAEAYVEADKRRQAGSFPLTFSNY